VLTSGTHLQQLWEERLRKQRGARGELKPEYGTCRSIQVVDSDVKQFSEDDLRDVRSNLLALLVHKCRNGDAD
jgi:hypothetical protein